MPNIKSNILARRIASETFAENGVITVDLNRQYDLMEMIVHLSGTFDLGTGTPTAIVNSAPAPLIKRIDLFADGSKDLAQVDGRLAAFGAFERGMNRELTAVTTAQATGKVIDCFYSIPMANFDGPRPKDSALHTTNPFMGLLQSRITMGSFASNIYTLGTGVISNIALTVDVYQHEIQEFNRGDAVEGRFIRRESLQELTISATQSSFDVTLPTGAFLRGVKLLALDDSGDAVDTVINNVTLKSGVNVRMDMPWDALRAKNKRDYRIDAAVHDDGFAYADLCPEGKLGNLFDLRRASDAKMTLDVTVPGGGNGTVIAHIVEFIERPGLAAAG